jgi:hypothetical protein
MATDTTRLRNALFTRLRSHYRTESAANEINDPDYWLRKFCQIISEEVLGEITGFAKCVGNDSNGDTHDNVGII